jgi:hypothetical protein
MTSDNGKIVCAFMTIFIQVFNLAEQIGIYWAQQQLNFDDADSRRFFFILFGITGLNMLKAFFNTERYQAVVSLLIEVGELISYLTLLGTTAAIIGVSVVFFVLELACHVVHIYFLDESEEKKIWGKIADFVQILIVTGMLGIGPILTIFLDSDSLFRQPIYEMPFIFVLFFCSVMFENMNVRRMLSKAVESDESRSDLAAAAVANPLQDKHVIEVVWMVVILLLSTLYSSLFLSILTIILVSMELQNGATLPSYDHGIYISLLVGASLTLAVAPCVVFCSCYGTIIMLQNYLNL